MVVGVIVLLAVVVMAWLLKEYMALDTEKSIMKMNIELEKEELEVKKQGVIELDKDKIEAKKKKGKECWCGKRESCYPDTKGWDYEYRGGSARRRWIRSLELHSFHCFFSVSFLLLNNSLLECNLAVGSRLI